jgi:hypothetical protein
LSAAVSRMRFSIVESALLEFIGYSPAQSRRYSLGYPGYR